MRDAPLGETGEVLARDGHTASGPIAEQFAELEQQARASKPFVATLAYGYRHRPGWEEEWAE